MKSVISSLNDVAEPFRAEYEERNGKFVLKIEDAPVGFVKAEDFHAANLKVVEFRDKNIALLKEVDTLRPLQMQFEGLDPVEAREAIARVKALGKKGIQDADDIDTRLKTMVDEAVKPLREQLSTSTAETQAERRRADEFLLTSFINENFVKAGGKPNAVQFVTGLAQDTFEVKDRKVVAKTGKFSSEKPGESLSVDEWLKSVAKDHDYVFAPSSGGGARPETSQGAPRVTVRAGQTVLKNPTPQELGAASADILSGKVKVEFDQVAQ